MNVTGNEEANNRHTKEAMVVVKVPPSSAEAVAILSVKASVPLPLIARIASEEALKALDSSVGETSMLSTDGMQKEVWNPLFVSSGSIRVQKVLGVKSILLLLVVVATGRETGLTDGNRNLGERRTGDLHSSGPLLNISI